MIGSDYFVRDPALPVDAVIADVNLDMPILTYRFEDVIAYGGTHSTLGGDVARIASAFGVTASPDPDPGQGVFIRSDQFSFARRGVPSLLLWPGRAGPGAAATEAFLSTRYHQPNDDISQPIDWAAAARFFDIVTALVETVATRRDRPAWRPNDALALAMAGAHRRSHR